MTYKKHKKTIRYLSVLVIFFFIGKVFINNLSELKEASLNFQPKFFIIAVFFSWGWMIVNSYIYFFLLNKLGVKVSFLNSFEVWIKSYLWLYVPGKIGVITSRIYMFKKKNVDSKYVISGIYFETLLSVLSSALIFFAMTPNIFSWNSPQILTVLLIVIAGVVFFLNPGILNFALKFLTRFIKKEFMLVPLQATPIELVFFLFLSFFKWFLIGLGIFFIINSITPVNIFNILTITGGYAIASIAGIVAVFSPSGLGVTESILVIIYKSFLPISLAIIISLIIRIWKITGEISLVLLYLIFSKASSKFFK